MRFALACAIVGASREGKVPPQTRKKIKMTNSATSVVARDEKVSMTAAAIAMSLAVVALIVMGLVQPAFLVPNVIVLAVLVPAFVIVWRALKR